MPTYEYKCGECGHRFEKFSSKITDASSVRCPSCGGCAERLISGGAGLLFKGSGFYTTDYRSDSYKAAAEKEDKTSTAKSSSDDSTASSKEKKPEPKKDAE